MLLLIGDLFRYWSLLMQDTRPLDTMLGRKQLVVLGWAQPVRMIHDMHSRIQNLDTERSMTKRSLGIVLGREWAY